MINKKGQVLVTFITMIPIILLLIGSLIEYSLITYNKHKLNSLTKSIITSCIENPQKNDIINLYNKNGIEADFNIIISDNIEIEFAYDIDSFLGKIIGKDHYKIYIHIVGRKDDEKIIFSKGIEND